MSAAAEILLRSENFTDTRYDKRSLVREWQQFPMWDCCHFCEMSFCREKGAAASQVCEKNNIMVKKITK